MNKISLNQSEKSNSVSNRKTQRGELLKRNEAFKGELKTIFERINEIYRKAGKENDFFERFDSILLQQEKVFIQNEDDEARMFWEDFCERWGIHPNWNRQLESLSEFIKTEPRVFYSWSKHGGNYILIEIEEWTSIEDVKKVLPKVEEMKRKHFKHSKRPPIEFDRNLKWYDLNIRQNKSCGWIAQRLKPKDKASEIKLAEKIKKGIQSIQSQIDRLTPRKISL